jgi:hypothetical protein
MVTWLFAGAFASLSWLAARPLASQAPASIGCEALDNGSRAAASFRAYRDGVQIAGGVCGKDVQVSAGVTELVVSLDGVLGSSEKRLTVTARHGAAERARASFETGELLVEVTRDGRRSTGLVELLVSGHAIGRLSAGVATRLVAGSYSIEIASRGDKRGVEAITIARGERRVLGVEFGTASK